MGAPDMMATVNVNFQQIGRETKFQALRWTRIGTVQSLMVVSLALTTGNPDFPRHQLTRKISATKIMGLHTPRYK
jgi:hypothetical protein